VILNAEVKKISSPILVRSVGNKIVKISEYAVVKIYLKGTVDRVLAIASITIEVYLVEDLRVNILIGNDTLKP